MGDRSSLWTFLRDEAIFTRHWWRGRLWCNGCYGKHWLWRTVSRCG